jgi:hypothetical protein
MKTPNHSRKTDSRESASIRLTKKRGEMENRMDLAFEVVD